MQTVSQGNTLRNLIRPDTRLLEVDAKRGQQKQLNHDHFLLVMSTFRKIQLIITLTYISLISSLICFHSKTSFTLSKINFITKGRRLVRLLHAESVTLFKAFKCFLLFLLTLSHSFFAKEKDTYKLACTYFQYFSAILFHKLQE